MGSKTFYNDFSGLESENLFIRKFEIDDVEDYYLFASDPEVTKFLRWGPHESKDVTLEYVKELLSRYIEGEDASWGIELNKTGSIIGLIHVMDFNSIHRKASIGIVLARKFWSSGYAKEALQIVLHHCFDKYNLNRIEAFCVIENQRAIDLAEKLGMKYEGILRQSSYQKGELKDFIVYSMLANEYRDSVESGTGHVS